MKHATAALLATLLLLAACGDGREETSAGNAQRDDSAPAEPLDTASALNALVEEYFDVVLEMNPLYATQIGVDKYNDRLANRLGEKYRARERELNQRYLDRMLAIDDSELDRQDRLTYETFRYSREQDLDGMQYPDYPQPINQFYSITNSFVQLGSGSSVHPFRSVDDYEDFLSRIDDFVVIVDQAIVNMKRAQSARRNATWRFPARRWLTRSGG